ncbi:MAG: polysaccharide biosynthesis/export family protein [Pseudomonadota bacterium]
MGMVMKSAGDTRGGHLAQVLAPILALIIAWLAVPLAAQEYRIQPGDTLRVEVLEDETLNRDVLVAPDGQIAVPLVGTVPVAGSSLPEAQRRLTAAIESNFAASPTVLLSLMRLAPRSVQSSVATPRHVFVIGEVRKPGSIAMEDGMTVLQVLSVAGGFTDFAAVKRIQLRRREAPGRERVFRFSYEAVLDGRSGFGMAPVEQGDVIIVPARRLFE